MAYIRWKGIDLSGTLRSGVMSVRSTQELISQLFQRDIALLSMKYKKPLPFFHRLSLDEKIDFFKHIALLISSGIFLDQALLLVMHSIKKKFFKDSIQDIVLDVQHGTSFSQSAQRYPMIFDALTIQMIQTGEESGRLVEALTALCAHQEVVYQFKKRVKSVLLMPLITFVFFLLIAGIIFMFIVPALATMIESAGQNLSTSTRLMLAISEFIQSRKNIGICAIAAISTAGSMIYLFSFPRVTKILQTCLIYIPVIKNLIYDSTFVYFFQSLSILTKTGVHLVTAFSIAHEAIGNSVIQKKIGSMLEAIQEGNSLSAVVMNNPKLFSEHVQALLAVGQESSCLPFIFGQIALLYKERIDKFLTTMATLVQPLLMIILGLLITALVFAVYVPLFNLSSVIA